MTLAEGDNVADHSEALLARMALPEDVQTLLKQAPSVRLANSATELKDLACGGPDQTEMEVAYTLPDGNKVVEATVVRTRNGICANYPEPYMRRRDPDCMVIADDLPSDKPRFEDRFSYPFHGLRQETLEWLAGCDLAVFGFGMGGPGMIDDALAIVPRNAAFFAFGLGLLQGVVDLDNLDRPFEPSLIMFAAPPFRHTHFDGKQVVVHRRGDVHEIFAYNLYPGPSAKKGVYGALIYRGSQEGWITAHCSAVQVVTPYDNIVAFMHEGASGGGKSEMLQQPHRMPDGRLCLGTNIVNGDSRYLEIPRTCDLHPVCDDMAICHPDLQEDNGKLWLTDAEHAWFVRVDHIDAYGVDHDLEALTVAPPEPLLFLNIDAVPRSTALIWEHTEDSPGVSCPNPRVIVPRRIVPGVVNGKVAVDFRSFGVRCPPCTREKPNYGILGLFHILPPALAWLWRLVAPRGHANPSIVDEGAMASEGVGSYWPFATGLMIEQANLLLEQFRNAPSTRYILTPNQHVGAWKTGFMPEWLARDYLARRGSARFTPDQLTPARCPLLGYSLRRMRIEGTNISNWFLQVETQPEVGLEAYDQGAEVLTRFFHRELQKYLRPYLDRQGRKIIECCLSGGTLKDYLELLPTENY